MSQFSDSYHLKTKNIQDGIMLLQNAKKRGYVFSPLNGWVTIVAEGEPFIANESIINSNIGILLHFINAEDHGWGFTLFDSDKQISHYSCFWEDELAIDDSELNIKVFDEFIGHEDQKLKKIKDVLYIQGIEEAFEKNVAKTFVDLIGITYHEWVSYDYVSNELEFYKQQCPGLVKCETLDETIY